MTESRASTDLVHCEAGAIERERRGFVLSHTLVDRYETTVRFTEVQYDDRLILLKYHLREDRRPVPVWQTERGALGPTLESKMLELGERKHRLKRRDRV